MVGLASGESAQLHVLNPGVPAPFLGLICTVRLSFMDDQNNELGGSIVHVLPGQAASITLDADADLGLTSGRLSIRGVIRTPPVGVAADVPAAPTLPYCQLDCQLVGTLEILDTSTGYARVVLPDARVVFPWPFVLPPQPAAP